MAKSKLILVTGAPRSGTSWIGKVLGTTPTYRYVYEPLNLNNQIPGSPVKVWFPMPEEMRHVEEWKKHLDQRIHMRGKYLEYRLSVHGLSDRLHYVKEALLGKVYPNRIVKDPSALFLSSWFSKEYFAKTCFVMRHPAAFVNSMIRQNWDLPLERLTRLHRWLTSNFDVKLQSLAPEKNDYVSRLAWQWLIMNTAVEELCNQNPRSIMILHDEIIRDPEPMIGKLFQKLDLSYTDKTKRYLIRTADESRGGRQLQTINQAWKKELKAKDIKKIRFIVAPLADRFYSGSSWAMI